MTGELSSGVIERGGFGLNFRVEGNGQNALVCGAADHYSRVFSTALRDKLRIAFADHRGFAAAPEQIPEESFVLETILDDYEAIRQELQFGTVVVIGHSGHAYMALEYAKKYPEHVSHVVMVGIAPDLSPESMEMAERYWTESVDPDRKAVMAENLSRMSDEQLARLPLTESFHQLNFQRGPKAWFDPRFNSVDLWDGVAPNEVLMKIWGETFSALNIRNGLSELKTPVLLALGRYDFLVAPPASWDPYRNDFHDLTIRIFEKSGHTPPLEQPEMFDAVLLEWLEERS